MIEQLLSSWICAAILLVTLICYQQLWLVYLQQRRDKKQITEININWYHHDIKHQFSSTLINVLPLLGLFGTIVGLLDCFSGLANSRSDASLISAGIADALLTTQLGLLCALPAWLLQSYILEQRPLAVNNAVAVR